MTTKERLHLLIDGLSEDEASELLHFAEEHTGAAYLCPYCGNSEHILNEETQRALTDAEAGVGVTKHRDASSFFAKLGL
jgi:hypothetical protein